LKHTGANDAAFPSVIDEAVAEGITVREWYASAALVGIMANSDLPDLMKNGWAPSKAAEICFMVADAMLAEAKKDRNVAQNKGRH
jgi:hypothetical protein